MKPLRKPRCSLCVQGLKPIGLYHIRRGKKIECARVCKHRSMTGKLVINTVSQYKQLQ